STSASLPSRRRNPRSTGSLRSRVYTCAIQIPSGYDSATSTTAKKTICAQPCTRDAPRAPAHRRDRQAPGSRSQARTHHRPTSDALQRPEETEHQDQAGGGNAERSKVAHHRPAPETTAEPCALG